MNAFFKIPYYHDYISPELGKKLLDDAQPVASVPGLKELGMSSGLETKEALQFLADLYRELEPKLAIILDQRILDRKFIDERVAAWHEFNQKLNRDVLDPDYKTILGLEDAKGRIVIGPKTPGYCLKGGAPIAPLPNFLKGPHVTLFGPPDSAKLAINAMNAFHRKLPTEPIIVETLLAAQKAAPMWGADDEDSKTPLRADLVDAAVNLSACFDNTISLTEGSKQYSLAKDHLSLPIKRFPGLALPCTFLFFEDNPIPLHLYDFALHLFRNWNNPRALVFYVPKLENEEEAAYIHLMVSLAERRIKELHPSYQLGTVRLMIVLENPRAILRAHEIMDELYPYFAGASLGWHDYLASTARIFKEDSNYRIPVKADPNIVIKYIKASHLLLAEVVGSRGGIKVGGMYGILPSPGNTSLQITLKGFIKDVITQMKRDLTGFWVAHPDFVRLGLALVEAWKQKLAGNSAPLQTLVQELLSAEYHKEICDFIEAADIKGLNTSDPNYVRSLIVADIKESDFIANNDPEEIRYNVFQSLQYLADWLCGNGCVALPTSINGIPVRVMDDLATAERSRWEVWHELYHGRFAVEDFLRISHEEMNFIRRDLANDKKIVQVKWDERTSKWYPIAMRIMIQLMTAKKPVEFATELLLPFTLESVRSSLDPWEAILKLDPHKFVFEKYVGDFHHYFEICGVERFAREMAKNAVEDLSFAENIISKFSLEEIKTAASFHGNIGESKRTLDARAASEQSLVLGEEDLVKSDLSSHGSTYLAKFGFKFLISAKGKAAAEILANLKVRLNNTSAQEIDNARSALWQISRKRMLDSDRTIETKIEFLREKHSITGASFALNYAVKTQVLDFGESIKGSEKVIPTTKFEIASLSKTIASAFSIEYFAKKNIKLETPMNQLLEKSGSSFRIRSPKDPNWADAVTLEHLMSHSALNMHYVNGVKLNEEMPDLFDLLDGNKKYSYEPVIAVNEPGKLFQYSGGGFLVLQHLLESLEGKSIEKIMRNYLDEMGLQELSFNPKAKVAHGYFDSGVEVPGSRLNFPAFAAGGLSTSTAMAQFLLQLSKAYQSLDGVVGISHDTAVIMLHGSDKGCRNFMGCEMGLGVFIAEAGENKFAIHQGANDGFRALYLQCFAGPDNGKGFVLLCNGDNRAVPFLAEVAQELLRRMEFQGVDFDKLKSTFDYKGLKQEEIVNLGYKTLIFDAFLPNLPEQILAKGPLDPLAKFNLAVGAHILNVSNQKFARAENLVSPNLPVFDPELFGRQGKIMDSWESARHNEAEFDSLILELKKKSEIRFVSFSTKFHDGNQAAFVALQGLDQDQNWVELLPKTAMLGHSLLQLDLGESHSQYSQIQVKMFPDGGLSRLGLFRELPAEITPNFKAVEKAHCIRFAEPIPKSKKPLTIPYSASKVEIQKNFARTKVGLVDLACLAYGGSVLSATNEHYGPAAQVVSPLPPIHMFDGLESSRSRILGHQEEVALQLGAPSNIERIVLDFHFFVNNNPLFISIDAFDGTKWVELVQKTKVKAFAGNAKEFLIDSSIKYQKLKIITYPDGGINRIKVLAPNPADATIG